MLVKLVINHAWLGFADQKLVDDSYFATTGMAA